MDLQRILDECLPLIRPLAVRQCQRYRLSPDDVEDFAQAVWQKICANEHAVLRQWEGRSQLQWYLATVIGKALQDHVDHLWGKWRPSATAQELGEPALKLERLLVRERMTFDEACHKLRIEDRVALSEVELADLAARLPVRQYWGRSRQDSGGDAAGHAAANRSSPASPFASPLESAEERLLRQEGAPRRRQARAALAGALAELPKEDLLILELRFASGWTLAKIARSMGLDQKRLYRRTERILERLERDLRRRGVAPEDIRDILREAGS